jgi:transcriptional antiterminator NusG
MKQWYVIQVYAGYEKTVQAELLKQIESQDVQDLFGEVLIPSAKMHQFFGADDALQDQQLFPGYMLVEMQSEREAIRLVNSIPRVLRFLGGKNPVPISQQEIDRVIAQMKGDMPVALQKHEFEVGREVEIDSGAFAGFVGIVDSIDEDGEKLTVMVSIFGRMTPVELQFDQVRQ